jgi:subtilisin family serine protease
MGDEQSQANATGLGPLSPEDAAAELTGRYLVLFSTFEPARARDVLATAAGISNVAASSDFGEQAIVPEQLKKADGVFFDTLGVGVVAAEPEQANGLIEASKKSDKPVVLAVEPERFIYSASGSAAQGGWDESTVSWGLQAIGATRTPYSGAGVRVAVLDTGIDKAHPDVGNLVQAEKSFIAGEDVQDLNGHGTHCIGIPCGPRLPQNTTRYGTAYDTELIVGKVLDDQDGQGDEQGVLAGINWAAANNARIISLSMASRVQMDERPSVIFEATARRLLGRGIVIVCAAGNHSSRSDGVIAPVGRPASCTSIVAVAALDERLKVANFSNGSVGKHGKIDIAAPGVNILSAYRSDWNPPYARGEGTSCSTPYVGGVLSLLAQSDREQTGEALIERLKREATSLSEPDTDVGAGLVQAP